VREAHDRPGDWRLFFGTTKARAKSLLKLCMRRTAASLYVHCVPPTIRPSLSSVFSGLPQALLSAQPPSSYDPAQSGGPQNAFRSPRCSLAFLRHFSRRSRQAVTMPRNATDTKSSVFSGLPQALLSAQPPSGYDPAQSTGPQNAFRSPRCSRSFLKHFSRRSRQAVTIPKDGVTSQLPSRTLKPQSPLTARIFSMLTGSSPLARQS
jgi:hypothetical protein